MVDATTLLVWFAFTLGSSESAVIEHWSDPRPTPKQWERAELKDRNASSIGVYLRGEFESLHRQLTPNFVEYVFEQDRLVITTLYFSEVEGPKSRAFFNAWLQSTFGKRPPTPSAVQKAADRITTYYQTPKATWKWVINGSDLTVRVSSNTRAPTALAESLALSQKKIQASTPAFVQAYSEIHLGLVKGKSEIQKVRQFLARRDVPPLMRADVELVLSMLLSAQFRRESTVSRPPKCNLALLEEAAQLAPRLKTQIQGLAGVCKTTK